MPSHGERFSSLEFEPGSEPQVTVVPESLDFGAVLCPARLSMTLAIGTNDGRAMATISSDEPWFAAERCQVEISPKPAVVPIWVTFPASAVLGLRSGQLLIRAGGCVVRVRVTADVRSSVVAVESVGSDGVDRVSPLRRADPFQSCREKAREVFAATALSAVLLTSVVLAWCVPVLAHGFVGLVSNVLLATTGGCLAAAQLLLRGKPERTAFLRHLPGIVATMFVFAACLAAVIGIMTGIRQWRDPFRFEIHTMSAVLFLPSALWAARLAKSRVSNEHAASGWERPSCLVLFLVMLLPAGALASLAALGLGNVAPPLPTAMSTPSFRIWALETGGGIGSRGNVGKRSAVVDGSKEQSLGVSLRYTDVPTATTVRFCFHSPPVPVVHRRILCAIVVVRLSPGQRGRIAALQSLNWFTKALKGTWAIVIMEGDTPVRTVTVGLK